MSSPSAASLSRVALSTLIDVSAVRSAVRIPGVCRWHSGTVKAGAGKSNPLGVGIQKTGLHRLGFQVRHRTEISIAELVRTFSHGNVADLLRIGFAQAKAQAEAGAVQSV